MHTNKQTQAIFDLHPGEKHKLRIHAKIYPQRMRNSYLGGESVSSDLASFFKWVRQLVLAERCTIDRALAVLDIRLASYESI